MRSRFGALLALVIIVTLVRPSSAASAAALTFEAGVEILPPYQLASAPATAELARAWTDALLLAESAPDQFGYPGLDTETQSVAITTTTPAGRQLAETWLASGIQHPQPKVGRLSRPQVTVSIASVSRSYALLEGIKHDATRLVEVGLPDAAAIYETAPDWLRNRVIITMAWHSDALISALAARYDPDAIAVRVEARLKNDLPAYDGRTHDLSPFYGGGIVKLGTNSGCSGGFSWIDTYSNYYMITAGHCVPTGAAGAVTTDANANTVDTMSTSGAVTSGTRENWTNGTGTVYFTGDSTYRGDVALVSVNASGKSVSPYMYSGTAPNQTAYSSVHSMWTTVPTTNENYCTGGSNTFAICGWVVGTNSVRVDHKYGAPSNEWVRNATKGYKSSGTSINGGDSGGPVYTVNGDGTIAAKGIISGGTTGPVSCTFLAPCLQVFTDILLPYYYFPGWIYQQ